MPFDTIFSTTAISTNYIARAMAYNTSDTTDYDMQQAYMNMILYARIHSAVGAYAGSKQSPSNLPGEIPSGSTYLEFLWDFNLINDHPHPALGADYAIRHNLDTLSPGTYTVTAVGATTVSSATDRVVMNVASNSGVVSVRVTGPAGALPDGWDIEVIKTADEATHDNTSLPMAQQLFRPEYLAMWQALNVDHIRFMKQTGTEQSVMETVAEMTKQGMASYQTPFNFFDSKHITMPVEDAVDLCNYIGCGIYWTTPHRLDDAAHDYLAQYISDNLNPGFPVYFEHYNEWWNFVYTGIRWFSAKFHKRFTAQGTGTLSCTKGSSTITSSGIDLTTVFDASTNRCTLGNYTYDVDPATITAGSFEIAFSGNAAETVTNGVYWPSEQLDNEEGYTIEATLAAKRWSDVFTANGDRSRLKTTLGIRTSGGNIVERLMTPANWATEPDYINPATVFDAAATNVYYGAGSFGWDSSNPPAVATAIRDAHVATPGSASSLIAEVFMGRHATYSVGQDLPAVRAEVKALKTACDTYNLSLISYEAGQHVVSSGPFSNTTNAAFWADVYDEWVLFLNSADALEVCEETVNIQIAYNDGPVNKFQAMQEWSLFGTFSELPYYDYAGDSQTATHDVLRAKPSFWLPGDAPLGALGTPKVFLDTGVSQTVDLKDYFSANATSFSAATVPAGMTLNGSTGLLTGTPTASNGNHVFTGTNANGSDTVTMAINVS